MQQHQHVALKTIAAEWPYRDVAEYNSSIDSTTCPCDLTSSLIKLPSGMVTSSRTLLHSFTSAIILLVSLAGLPGPSSVIALHPSRRSSLLCGAHPDQTSSWYDHGQSWDYQRSRWYLQITIIYISIDGKVNIFMFKYILQCKLLIVILPI